jgi:uridine phosphorylase
METSAIYGLGKLLGHSCLSLSAIVANRVVQEFSTRAGETIDRLIRTTLQILSDSEH